MWGTEVLNQHGLPTTSHLACCTSDGFAPVIVDQLMDALATTRSGGVTILLVEQDVRPALSAADRGYVLETRRVVQSGPARELIVQRAHLNQ